VQTGADVRAVVASRAAIPDNASCPDDLTRDEVKALLLSMMSGVVAAKAELDAYLDRLAELSARAGASNTERGAAVGISKQAAAKRWGDPRASRVAQQ
jgi:hypothetical protein